MTTMQLHTTLPVAEHFLVALFNDDITGLDDQDYYLLKEWCLELPQTVMFEVVKDNDDDDDYLSLREDSVTGKLANCALINVYTPINVH